MTPESSEECQREIDHLRRHELDFDELFVDAIDPNDGEVVARLYLQFRAPFSSRRQEGYGMTHQDQTKGPVKWQYDFSITEDDSARVLHEFSNEYSAMKCEPSLSYSKEHGTFYLKDNAKAPAELRDANMAGLNVYIPTGTPRSTWDAASKNQPRKERDEIQCCSILYFDGDFLDQDGNVIATEESRLADIKAAVTARTIPSPGLIINSGNGLQCFWRPREPLEPEQAEGRNRWLIELLHGDKGVWDRGRLMRVGGGINWPSQKKIDKGCVPIVGRIIAINDDAWASADQFQWVPEEKKKKEEEKTEKKEKTSGDQNEHKHDGDAPAEDPVAFIEDPRLDKVNRECKALIKTGDFSKFKNHRSAAQFRVACHLRLVGCSEFVVRSAFENFPINDGMADKSRKLDGEITRLIERADLFNVDPDMYAMNEKHAAVSVAGLFKVITWVPDQRYPKQPVGEFSSKASFTSIYVNPRMTVEVEKTDAKGKTVKKTEQWGRGKWWLAQSNYTQHDGITFKPGAPPIVREHGRTYANMWGGHSVEPDRGENPEERCQLYLRHVRDNISGGDAAVNAYTLDWMASGVQRIDDPDRSALSLRGEPGVGKGVFSTGYGTIFGRHFLSVTQPEHLTGKFNAHEAEACLIVADEVAFAGDPKAARIFKTKITEPTKMLERKGIDPIEVNNYARLIFHTNDEHPLIIEVKDRRILALNVQANVAWRVESIEIRQAEKRKAYFMPILHELEYGGREALLGFLLARDISNFNAEAFPETPERDVQKLLSASGGDAVVMQFAQEGVLPGAISDRPHIAMSNGPGNLFEHMEHHGGRDLWKATPHALGRILTRWGFKGWSSGIARGWKAPPLPVLRAAIKAKYPAIIWEQPHLTEWGQRLTLNDQGRPDINDLRHTAEAAAAAVKAAEAAVAGKTEAENDPIPF
jgi:hypothetical protein